MRNNTTIQARAYLGSFVDKNSVGWIFVIDSVLDIAYMATSLTIDLKCSFILRIWSHWLDLIIQFTCCPLYSAAWRNISSGMLHWNWWTGNSWPLETTTPANICYSKNTETYTALNIIYFQFIIKKQFLSRIWKVFKAEVYVLYPSRRLSVFLYILTIFCFSIVLTSVQKALENWRNRYANFIDGQAFLSYRQSSNITLLPFVAYCFSSLSSSSVFISAPPKTVNIKGFSLRKLVVF